MEARSLVERGAKAPLSPLQRAPGGKNDIYSCAGHADVDFIVTIFFLTSADRSTDTQKSIPQIMDEF